ncbi:hypothetical protein K432DRAFT_405367 [Lepidopterella palustris CBS 459.81]|uniref:Uncharacterized protein n=1 Tax=Lepidopterella palustris CBS 459.81 TaxID=1314670 RepID=A0A8E2JEN0_9PEZI|nr:hypothetical protein K432DRAFT_405367 [Lepidopterella palustris CBS 459.81]
MAVNFRSYDQLIMHMKIMAVCSFFHHHYRLTCTIDVGLCTVAALILLALATTYRPFPPAAMLLYDVFKRVIDTWFQSPETQPTTPETRRDLEEQDHTAGTDDAPELRAAPTKARSGYDLEGPRQQRSEAQLNPQRFSTHPSPLLDDRVFRILLWPCKRRSPERQR